MEFGSRTSNGIIESLLGEVASLIGGVQDLIVKDGEVEGKTQADGVSRGKLSLSNLSSGLVGFERLVGGVLAAVANSELGKVTVVVTLPVEEKHKKVRQNAAREAEKSWFVFRGAN